MVVMSLEELWSRLRGLRSEDLRSLSPEGLARILGVDPRELPLTIRMELARRLYRGFGLPQRWLASRLRMSLRDVSRALKPKEELIRTPSSISSVLRDPEVIAKAIKLIREGRARNPNDLVLELKIPLNEAKILYEKIVENEGITRADTVEATAELADYVEDIKEKSSRIKELVKELGTLVGRAEDVVARLEDVGDRIEEKFLRLEALFNQRIEDLKARYTKLKNERETLTKEVALLLKTVKTLKEEKKRLKNEANKLRREKLTVEEELKGIRQQRDKYVRGIKEELRSILIRYMRQVDSILTELRGIGEKWLIHESLPAFRSGTTWVKPGYSCIRDDTHEVFDRVIDTYDKLKRGFEELRLKLLKLLDNVEKGFT